MLTKMKKISLVIPMYKVGKFLRQCLESCLDQDIDESEYEVIAVDDESPDESRAIAMDYASRHGNIKVIAQKHAGLSAARNLGLANAEGNYVWFIDSDDWILSDCLGEIVSECYGNNLDILAVSAANVIGSTQERRFRIKDTAVCEGKSLVDDGKLQLCAPFSIYRRSFLTGNSLTFMEGIYHEDAEFTPRAYYLADRAGAIDKVMYFVRQNEDSITRSYNPQRSIDYLDSVIPSLSKFSEDIPEKARQGFDNLIASNLSNALKDSITLNKADRAALDRHAYGQRKCLKHLRRSKVLKYRIEGYVLSLFPRRMSTAYRIMKMIQK